MSNGDAFQRRRAHEARAWLAHPDRAVEIAAERVAQARADAKAGHVPACSLTKCAANCPSRR